jgi:hypothetical protein
MSRTPSSGRFAATFSPRGEEVANAGVSLFSPTGRRRAEGPDEEAGSKVRSEAEAEPCSAVRSHE